MKNLFTATNKAHTFQTFTTEQVANGYGVALTTIRNHKAEHSDEIAENIHFVYEVISTNGGKQEMLKWTLRGIVKLGMFIRSKEAKKFRLWAEQELEKSILAELEKANEIREKNITYVNEISNLKAYQMAQGKHHNYQVLGYKSQISQKNKEIVALKQELVKAQKIYTAQVDDDSYKAMYKNAILERNYYYQKCQKLKECFFTKEQKTFQILNDIRTQLDKTYTDVGALIAYVWEDNDYFIQNR
ncbi:hypothetical protein CPIN17260_1108 [Campylobacter pinnipediorum subsp. pinnipediorum]|uniref:hypothetical protein n=1 Tax=Campylobacter pinnipediorum TaxID=1965231 RepID=UPI000995B61F|nr:hypothetical protein [Campylobacter pinnipediorum]AQW81397.1 hypothetical protein CPIN17260_1108 [Campylobacter pinnipediorum subsp. pinnipediorum]